MVADEYPLILQKELLMTPSDQLRLIQRLAVHLSHAIQPSQPGFLVYGKYRDTLGREFSTEEDFKLAEWHPTYAELDDD